MSETVSGTDTSLKQESDFLGWLSFALILYRDANISSAISKEKLIWDLYNAVVVYWSNTVNIFVMFLLNVPNVSWDWPAVYHQKEW